jgi:hypothetical protein
MHCQIKYFNVIFSLLQQGRPFENIWLCVIAQMITYLLHHTNNNNKSLYVNNLICLIIKLQLMLPPKECKAAVLNLDIIS